jgi:DNA-damage-inducible protein D
MMKSEQIHSLTSTYEEHAQTTADGVKYWLAHDLVHVLGYSKWGNFLNAVSMAKTACEISGHYVSNHFADVGKMVAMPKGGEKEMYHKILLPLYI